jgi:hypothetical protein
VSSPVELTLDPAVQRLAAPYQIPVTQLERVVLAPRDLLRVEPY